LKQWNPGVVSPDWIQQLVLAADQFIVDRPLSEDPKGKTVIAGYPWFGDWGRDTMIALPGLTIATGRPELAGKIISTFSRYLDQGMLPNVFPEVGEQPEYNTVDAILWYFEAVRAYYSATQDRDLIQQIFPALVEVIEWHQRGTRYGIHLEADGLLYAGEPGVQLTWMDAKVGDWVITPRIGKPIEINALWYNALRTMVSLAGELNLPAQDFNRLAEKAIAGFQRYWLEEKGYCADVLDGPDGNDEALRPNQIFAVMLPDLSCPWAALLEKAQQKSVVDTCSRALVTSYGLRSLAPDHPDYVGTYSGDQLQRDQAYHQGTVWGWLIGPFIQAHLRAYGDPTQAQSFLMPMVNHLQTHGVGSLSEIFEGDAPFYPRGCVAQAWSVAEVLRTWRMIQEYDVPNA
ncbi:MAG: amylo-alpha-1,6-glucosidase, partial [Cyanobacteria bacterium P01_F01_bin.42]